MAFTTPSYSLPDLFARINHGELQLPDFQRSFSWDTDRVRSLIVTVLRGYPVGALLALDTRNEPMRFRPRPMAGAPDTGENPGLLLLVGRNRLGLYLRILGGGSISGFGKGGHSQHGQRHHHCHEAGQFLHCMVSFLLRTR